MSCFVVVVLAGIGYFPTRDVLAELVIRLLQRLHQLWDATLLDQGNLVVHVLIDEVASGAGGETLHLLVVAVEQLHQLPNALQAAHLETGWNEGLTDYRIADFCEYSLHFLRTISLLFVKPELTFSICQSAELCQVALTVRVLN